MITIAADSEATTDDRVKQAFFIVEPNREQLSRIGHMLDVGDLRMVVDGAAAHSSDRGLHGRSSARRGRGKVVVAVAAQGGAIGKN